MTPLLLDTSVLIWAIEDMLPPQAAEALNVRARSGVPVYISPISAWEIGLLVSHGRYAMGTSPLDWFERAAAAPGTVLAHLSAAILVASSFLPGAPPRDPADRILIATARALVCPLMTRDRALLAYADQGHMQVVPC